MKRIKQRQPSTPAGATYAAPISKSGTVLTIEYYGISGSVITQGVATPARVMTEDQYKKLVEPTGPKPKADPRTKTLKKSADLPKGREITSDGEKEGLKLHDKPDELDIEKYTAGPEIKVKKGTPPKGRSLGGKVEKLGVKVKKAKVYAESTGDETTYTWRSILEALAEMGQMDIADELLVKLNGKEQQQMESARPKSNWANLRARLAEAEGDNFVFDDQGAQDDFQQDMSGGEGAGKKR